MDQRKVDESLKPCPFCGSRDIEIEDNSPDDEPETDWIILCNNCGSALIASNDGMPCTRNELTARWNRRIAPKVPPPDTVYYWPMAITQDGKNLITYDSAFTMEKAMEQFGLWEDHYGYKIKEAWIECTDGKRIEVARKWVEVMGK